MAADAIRATQVRFVRHRSARSTVPYLVNAAEKLFDKMVRLARQRDPQSKLVGVSISAVRVPKADFGRFVAYFYSPLDDSVVSYQVAWRYCRGRALRLGCGPARLREAGDEGK